MQSHAVHSIAFNMFLHFVTLWRLPLTFQTQNHTTLGYHKVISCTSWDQSFLSYAADKHTHTHTDADERITPATVVGVSNNDRSHLFDFYEIYFILVLIN